ncbi:lamin tail domain-containing protein [Halorussus halophilus]|uniref:lamin tail domain-containing protein n=1 Tax=Halorussus halophilus TaxID=2650975 RepID=UPI0017881379|nr:lamin tail domain-containing protein [Halorussus halophilus]
MQRRSYLKLLAGAVTTTSVSTGTTLAADSKLESGTWYDATITDNIDGDTVDVELDSDGTQYNIRTLGMDTPEKSGNTRYEQVEGWEGIEDEAYLETWGNNASDFAKNELPVGTNVQIAVDSESEEIDQYDRLLAKIRYDRTGDGSMDTVYNKYAVEQGYARVYCASMSNTDEYWDAENDARANDVGVWQQSDPSTTSEVRDNDVAQTFHPNTTSVKTNSGAIADSRVPIWAESEATQTLESGAVDYGIGSIPLVGVDAANNLALFGSQPIQEDHEDMSDHLEHFVFVTNLIDSLTDGDRSGMVLVDGGHHQFNADHSCSSEDTVFYQRYLEGQGIELASINSFGDSTGPNLTDARAVIVTSPEDSFTSAEITELQNLISDGGAVILMGSYKSTASQRSNLDDVASGVGSDLRLNEDEVTDSTNNVNDDSDFITSANHNTTDFSLWSAYSGSSTGYVLSIDRVVRNADSLNEEYVDVTNDGASSLDLSGWTMDNEEGESYTFPDGFSLAAGDTVRVHTGSGTDSSTDLYWGASMFRWDNDADRCAIYDGNGNLAQDSSWSVQDVIIPGIDGDNEWVDFENVSDDSVDMTGWSVEDEAGNTYNFPDSFSLASGDTVRLHTGSGTDSSTDLYWGSSYVWNNDGDTAYLYDASGNLVQKRTYPAPYSVSVTDMSLDEETLNDEWVDITNEGSSVLDMSGFSLEDEAGYDYVFPDSFTLGAGDTVRVHTGEGTDTATDLYWGYGIGVWNDDGDTAYVYDDNEVLADKQNSADLGGGSSSKIVVGEIDADGSSTSSEWVEFDNTGSTDQDMTGWTVEDEAGHTYTFPDNYTLTAGGTVRLYTDSGTDSSTDGELYWDTSYIWNNSGDTVYLYEPDGTLHTSKSY